MLVVCSQHVLTLVRTISAVPILPNINFENISSSACYGVNCLGFERSVWLLGELGFSTLTRLKPKRGTVSVRPPMCLQFSKRVLQIGTTSCRKITHLRQVCFVLFCFPGVTTHCGCIFTAQQRALASSCSRFIDHTQRRPTFGGTPLDE